MFLSPSAYYNHFNDKRGTNYNINDYLDRFHNIRNMVLKMMEDKTRNNIQDKYASIYEETIEFSWVEKKAKGIYAYHMSVGSGSAEFSYAYVGPNDPNSWQKIVFPKLVR